MRQFWHVFLFLLPTVLVVAGFVKRKELQAYLVEQGVLTPTKEERPSPQLPPTPEKAAIKEKPSTTAFKPKASPTGASEEEMKKRFPMPKFRSLEEVTGNWTMLSKAAFPASVTTKKPIKVELILNGRVAGSSSVRDGSEVYPVSLAKAVLTVATQADGTGPLGKIGIDDTDFKSKVARSYEDWKQRQTALVEKLRKAEMEKSLINAESSETMGPKPEIKSDGRIPLVEESIKVGQVKEIRLDRIQYWRFLGPREHQGQFYWAAAVGYLAQTIFGDLQAEGMALIREGKVVKWVYSGSEEPIK